VEKRRKKKNNLLEVTIGEAKGARGGFGFGELLIDLTDLILFLLKMFRKLWKLLFGKKKTKDEKIRDLKAELKKVKMERDEFKESFLWICERHEGLWRVGQDQEFELMKVSKERDRLLDMLDGEFDFYDSDFN
jgi:hypothetical protein